jgi:hypothetical protein
MTDLKIKLKTFPWTHKQAICLHITISAFNPLIKTLRFNHLIQWTSSIPSLKDAS